MNKKSIVLAASALAIIVSCNVREDVLPLSQKTAFKAVMADVPPTKTVLQSDGSVFWSPGDAINLFYGDVLAEKMVYDSTASVAAEATFTGELPRGFAPNGSDEFWAVYPYSRETFFDGSSVTLSLPEVQTAVEGTFADDLFISLARSTGYELSFYNLCGGIKFSVANPGIQSVTFQGLNDEVLSGQVKVTFNAEGKPVVQEPVKYVNMILLNAPDGKEFEVGKWYYMVSLPAELTNGYRMSFYGQDGEMVAERISEDPVTIKRAVWGRLTEADYVAESISPSKYLTFTSTEATTIFLSNSGDNAPVLYYSTDAQNWTLWDYSELTFTADAPLYICGDNPDGFSFAENRNSTFLTSGASFSSDMYSVSGDIMSLINMESEVLEIPNPYCFYNLFGTNEKLISAPTLPATTLTEGCYKSMFGACSNLVEAPALPATTLAESCYHSMFAHCSSLAEAPDLPAAQLAKGCYAYMFYDCGSLEAAPSLSAATLAEECYRGMFYSSGKLSYIKCLATDFSASDCLTDWVYGVATTGTFVKMFDAQWSTGNSGIPEGWTVETYGLPNNEIWYTSTDGEVVNPYATDVFGATIVSNTYSNGKGVIRFDGDVTSVGDNAFSWSGSGNARNLTSIVLPETVISIGNSAFFQCSNLTGVNIPEGVTSIGYSAFLKCESLPSIELPQSLTSIGQEAFLYCNELTTVYIPSSVTSLSSGVFAGCRKLESFTGKYASADGRALIVGTEMKAFAPAGLTTYTIPDGVTSVANEVFRDLENLEEVVFPEGIRTLGGVFYYCYDLKSVTIPSTVTSMYSAFLDACTVGDALYVLPTTPPTVSANNIPLFRNSNEFPIYVPANSVEAYKAATGWSDYADRIQAIEGGITASKYLTFTSEGTTTVSMRNEGNNAPVLYYSTDAQHWTLWDYGEIVSYADAPLYICGDNPNGFSRSTTVYSTFTTTGDSFSVSGDVMSLLDKDADLLTVPDYSFYYLFNGCSQLKGAPMLPATSLSMGCYSKMFYDCTGLTIAPELPASILASSCYMGMFQGCTSLTTAPALPSVILADYCYSYMFCDCTSLTSAPELPASTLTAFCYDCMFTRCSGLTEAPELPATSLADGCYYYMFDGCMGLTTAPELPATTLTNYCYEAMFNNCVNLASAPVLPAGTLVNRCYLEMFKNCSELSYVKCLATDISASRCLESWMGGVSSQGTFVKMENVQWPTGSSGIPDGWTVEEAVSASNYLTFSSTGSSMVYLTSTGGADQPVLYYSYDTVSWELWDYSTLTFTADAPLYLCGSNPSGFSFDVSAYSTLGIYGDNCSVSGDVMSLLYKDGELTQIPNSYCFAFLFGGSSLVSGPDLPATSLAIGCYYGMFQGNTGLTSAPALPAESMADNCYANMFYGCTSLTTAPELPATSLASSCYANMFHGCTALAEAPSLPLMNLGYRCYYGMFQECTSLVTAPALPATTMVDECYHTMFLNCTSLTTAPELPATTLAPSCYWGMFGGCSALETAPELPATTLAGSCYYNMFERCTSLTTAPILSAPTLEFSCYAAMFAGCSNLSYVKCLATDISASECTLSWMNSVSSTGLFIKAANSQWPTGINGIPEGWTVMNDGDVPGGGNEGTGDEDMD